MTFSRSTALAVVVVVVMFPTAALAEAPEATVADARPAMTEEDISRLMAPEPEQEEELPPGEEGGRILLRRGAEAADEGRHRDAERAFGQAVNAVIKLV